MSEYSYAVEPRMELNAFLPGRSLKYAWTVSVPIENFNLPIGWGACRTALAAEKQAQRCIDKRLKRDKRLNDAVVDNAEHVGEFTYPPKQRKEPTNHE